MTRVLGDFGINKDIVPPMADILSYSRNSTAAFIVLACDGIWDVMSNDDVAKFVTERVEKHSLEEIASELLDECLRRESTDNMSLYIIKIWFSSGRTIRTKNVSSFFLFSFEICAMICIKNFSEDHREKWHLSRSILIDLMRLAIDEILFLFSFYSISAKELKKIV